MTMKALGLVLAIGVLATLAAWLLPRLAVEFIGGSAYRDLASMIWAFAAIGTIWSMIQLLVYNLMARQAKRTIGVVWAGLVALVAAAPSVESMAFLITAVVSIESLVLLVLLVLAIRRTPVPAAATSS